MISLETHYYQMLERMLVIRKATRSGIDITLFEYFHKRDAIRIIDKGIWALYEELSSLGMKDDAMELMDRYR